MKFAILALIFSACSQSADARIFESDTEPAAESAAQSDARPAQSTDAGTQESSDASDTGSCFVCQDGGALFAQEAQCVLNNPSNAVFVDFNAINPDQTNRMPYMEYVEFVFMQHYWTGTWSLPAMGDAGSAHILSAGAQAEFAACLQTGQ